MPLDLIDDLEGEFPHLPLRAGRNGGWYMIHDDSYGQATSAAALLDPELEGSRYAAHIDGAGFTSWGAQLGVALTAPAAGYDATGYCGVRFMAKGAGPQWALMISDRQSVPEGGVCGAWDTEACYHFVGKTFSVGAEWQAVEIAFDELTPVMDPTSDRRLDASAIYDIIFNFHSAQGDAFELLVDDLSFIQKTATGCPLTK